MAIIGMEKNTGKTTVLNYLLANTPNCIFAVTSIGYDGEEVDQVTQTSKPLIFIRPQTVVATASSLLSYCDFTREIICMTGLYTSLGEVVIARALSCGYARLAGPSTVADMAKLVSIFKIFKVDKILIDGALARKSTLSVADSCILSTGASFSPDYTYLLNETLFYSKLLSLSLPVSSFELSNNDLTRHMTNNNDCLLITSSKDAENAKKVINLGSSLSENIVSQIFSNISSKSAFLFNGAVPSRMVKQLLLKSQKLQNLSFIATDSASYQIESQQYYDLIKRKAKLYVINPVKLLAITINPFAPYSNSLDANTLLSLFKSNTNIPIFDLSQRA